MTAGKYLFKVSNKDTTATSMKIVLSIIVFEFEVFIHMIDKFLFSLLFYFEKVFVIEAMSS